MVNFIYSEKGTNFCKVSTVDLSYVVTVKSTVELLQNFVAFSEYMNQWMTESMFFTLGRNQNQSWKNIWP